MYPYNNLLFLYANSYGVGTAFLIDEYHALTVAHNLFFDGHIFKEIYLYPYAQGTIKNQNSRIEANFIRMEDCRYPKEYINNFRNGSIKQLYDYAIIKL